MLHSGPLAALATARSIEVAAPTLSSGENFCRENRPELDSLVSPSLLLPGAGEGPYGRGGSF